MPSLLQVAALIALTASLTGCLMPPCELGVGVGLTNANAKQKAPQATFQFRAGAHPLQLVKSQADRSYDVGAGVVVDVDASTTMRTMTSLYAEGLGVIHRQPVGGGAIGRVEAGARARLTWDRIRGVIRPGVEPIMKAEIAKFFSASVNDPSINEVGAVHGELAGGVYLGGYFGGGVWSITSGLFMRVPAIAYAIAPEH